MTICWLMGRTETCLPTYPMALATFHTDSSARVFRDPPRRRARLGEAGYKYPTAESRAIGHLD